MDSHEIRQADVLGEDGRFRETIVLVQSKTKRRITIPVSPALRAALRRYLAVMVYEKYDKDLRVAQEFLGHESIATTGVYLLRIAVV